MEHYVSQPINAVNGAIRGIFQLNGISSIKPDLIQIRYLLNPHCGYSNFQLSWEQVTSRDYKIIIYL